MVGWRETKTPAESSHDRRRKRQDRITEDRLHRSGEGEGEELPRVRAREGRTVEYDEEGNGREAERARGDTSGYARREEVLRIGRGRKRNEVNSALSNSAPAGTVKLSSRELILPESDR